MGLTAYSRTVVYCAIRRSLACGKINERCYEIDAFAHAIKYLNGKIDCSTIHFAQIPGISAILVLSLEKIREIDAELLDLVRQAIKEVDH